MERIDHGVSEIEAKGTPGGGSVDFDSAQPTADGITVSPGASIDLTQLDVSERGVARLRVPGAMVEKAPPFRRKA